MSKKNFAILAAISLIALLLYLATWFLFDASSIELWLRSISQRGRLLFWVAAALAASLSVPRQIIALAAGMAYGWSAGLLLCSLAVLTGNSVQFFVSRALLQPFLRRRAAGALAKMDEIAALGPFKIVLMLRLLPAGHSGMVNLAAGASKEPVLSFLSASYLGQLPQNAVFSLAGDGFAISSSLRLCIAGGLFIVSLCLGLGLYRRYKSVFPATGTI